MKKQTIFLVVRLVALLLACTAFTLITAPLGGRRLHWNFFDCAYRNGWGFTYASNYSLAEVLAYLVAYGLGIISYLAETRKVFLTRVAMLICFLGFVSFSIELSHWFFDYHLSLIASFPVVPLLIDAWALVVIFVWMPRATSV